MDNHTHIWDEPCLRAAARRDRDQCFWTPEFKDGKDEHAFRHEVEIGLPYRFQLDLYQNWGIADGKSFYKGSSVELRYALAKWGKIPLNPTLYGEWNFNDNASDVWELKLLLGESFAQRWNWAANFTFEQETGGGREREVALSSALTYAVIDPTLNIGIEMLWERKTEKESRQRSGIRVPDRTKRQCSSDTLELCHCRTTLWSDVGFA